VEGLLREGSRKPGKAPVAVGTVAKVLALTNADLPGQLAESCQIRPVFAPRSFA